MCCSALVIKVDNKNNIFFGHWLHNKKHCWCLPVEKGVSQLQRQTYGVTTEGPECRCRRQSSWVWFFIYSETQCKQKQSMAGINLQNLNREKLTKEHEEQRKRNKNLKLRTRSLRYETSRKKHRGNMEDDTQGKIDNQTSNEQGRCRA